MNSNQHVALRIGLLLIVVMGLYPPWRGSVVANNVRHDAKAGYRFLFSPPEEGDIGNGSIARLSGGAIINLPLLATQWVVVASLTALAVSLLRHQRNP
jgi:hypothetical protein